jgi:hypothetical protein
MGKTGRSETQNTYPAWLSAYLQPLIKGSVERLGEFQSQGHNVLQGKPYNEGVTPAAQGNKPWISFSQGGGIDPDVWAQIVANSRKS